MIVEVFRAMRTFCGLFRIPRSTNTSASGHCLGRGLIRHIVISALSAAGCMIMSGPLAKCCMGFMRGRERGTADEAAASGGQLVCAGSGRL